jgi:hypothetical protein
MRRITQKYKKNGWENAKYSKSNGQERRNVQDDGWGDPIYSKIIGRIMQMFKDTVSWCVTKPVACNDVLCRTTLHTAPTAIVVDRMQHGEGGSNL